MLKQEFAQPEMKGHSDSDHIFSKEWIKTRLRVTGHRKSGLNDNKRYDW